MVLWIPLVCLLGIAACLQGATNGALGARIGIANTVALNAVVVFAGSALWWWLAPKSPPALGTTPWWLYLGGLYGLFIVGAAAFLFPRLGAGATTALMIGCQLLAALCLDHFGWFGDRFAVTPVRLVGALLLAAGAVLVLWPRLRA
jgi:bacterial/archaeal transporter family-2 protein